MSSRTLKSNAHLLLVVLRSRRVHRDQVFSVVAPKLRSAVVLPDGDLLLCLTDSTCPHMLKFMDEVSLNKPVDLLDPEVGVTTAEQIRSTAGLTARLQAQRGVTPC